MKSTNLRTHIRRFVLPPASSIQRRPTDVIYFILGAVVLFSTSLILFATRGHFEVLDLDLFRLINALPDSIAQIAWALMQAGSLAAVPIVVLLALLAGRVFLARNLLAGGLAAWVLNKVVKVLVNRGRPGDLLEEVIVRGGTAEGLGFPSGHVTVAAALATIASPYLSRRVAWLSWLLVGLVALGRIYVGAHFPIDAIGGVALGVMLGALTNLLLGVPHEDLAQQHIREGFKEYGIELKDVVPVSDDARGSRPYFAKAMDGTEYFVKLLGTEHRNADFLFKIWRSLFLKNVVNSAPFLTPKQQAEHEAYLTLLARSHEVRTPEVEFAARVGDAYALLVQKRVRGETLTEASTLDDALMTELWQQVKQLHEANIAHGDLRLANILVDEQGKPWLIDFGFADGGVGPTELSQDSAQLLASLAKVVGPERAVASALAVLGAEAVRQCVPGMKPVALSSATRADLKEEPDLLDNIREEVIKQTGNDIEEERSVLRIEPKSVLWVVGLGIGVYLLLPQIGELGQVVELWKSLDFPWLVAGLVTSALTYVMATVTQFGAQQAKLPFWPTFLAQFAASFANRFGPRGIGAAVLLEQYLEKMGLKRRSAITSLTLKTVAGIIVHVVAMLLTISWLGLENVELLDKIEMWHLWLLLTIVVAALAYVFSSSERTEKIKYSAKGAWRDLVATLKQPRKALQLCGGAVGMNLFYMATFLFSMWALDVDVSPLTVAAVYLAGEIIGSASPTPGGIGVLEGAFVAGFKAFGISSEAAVAGVLLYRLLTFWLPILPGFFAFHYMQDKEYI
ncbi:MAG: flippase-like domain-containing protein [Ardenticatenales bacterium]|nr:flippase-like domain-containing protein [Ardenticatenales bacterium]